MSEPKDTRDSPPASFADRVQARFQNMTAEEWARHRQKSDAAEDREAEQGAAFARRFQTPPAESPTPSTSKPWPNRNTEHARVSRKMAEAFVENLRRKTKVLPDRS